MFDMHQGFTGEETRELAPSVGTVVIAQLDVAVELTKGEWRRAAKAELAAARVAASLVRDAIASRLFAKRGGR